MHAALLSGLMILAQAAAGAPVVLACDIPSPPGRAIATAAPHERIFRVGPGSIQEWNDSSREFGPNLCAAFGCVKTADRSEGTISSASVAFTVGVVNSTGQGYWRAAGASGLAVTRGACRVITPPARRP